MRAMLAVAWSSAWHRRFVLSLIVASIALSTFLLLTLERLRADVRDTFAQSVSGADLIVGPRTGPVQLLLYAVFRIGGAGNNMKWSSAEAIGAHRAVQWWVPLSLGDSHRGFPVLATSRAYFERFRYGDRRPLVFAQGQPFSGEFDAVIGAEVARRLGYPLGEQLVLSHGDGAFESDEHADKPFVVSGILAPTGTPVDRTVHIGLRAMDAMHADWIGGVKLPGLATSHDDTPKPITAMLVGLKHRSAALSVQRDIANFEGEPLMAILPAVTLDELWQVVGAGERALEAMVALVALVSLAGLVAAVLAGLEQRRRELAVLRAVGAGPRHVAQLLVAEGLLVTLAGVATGAAAHWAAVALMGEWLRTRLGVGLVLAPPGAAELLLMGAVAGAGLLASLVPGWRAYRLSLADGLSPRT
ncbi:MAG TPA: ABC transporter permease [Albitalea sp.]